MLVKSNQPSHRVRDICLGNAALIRSLNIPILISITQCVFFASWWRRPSSLVRKLRISKYLFIHVILCHHRTKDNICDSFHHQFLSSKRNASSPPANNSNGKQWKRKKSKLGKWNLLCNVCHLWCEMISRGHRGGALKRHNRKAKALYDRMLRVPNDSITLCCMLRCLKSRKKHLSGPAADYYFNGFFIYRRKIFCRNYIIWILSTWNFLLFTENEESKAWILLLKLLHCQRIIKNLAARLGFEEKRRFLCNFHLLWNKHEREARKKL